MWPRRVRGSTVRTTSRGNDHGPRLRRQAVHPGLRPPRVVPEEDVRDRGRSDGGGDQDHLRRQEADLRGHGEGGRARRRRGVRGRAGRRAVRLGHPRARGRARPVADDAGREVRPERVRLPVRRRVRRPHRQVRPARLQGARPLQPGRRPGDERAPDASGSSGSPTGCTRTTASSCSSSWSRPRTASSRRSAATPTATTPSCAPS